MIEPLPKCFSMWASAASSALCLSILFTLDDTQFRSLHVPPYGMS